MNHAVEHDTIWQVSQLEIEIQGIPKSIRSQYTSRLKQAKTELAKYKKQSKETHAQLAKSDLLGRGPRSVTSNTDDPYDEHSERTRLLAGTESLNDGSRRLADSARLALEAEEQGADILRTLRVQREQMENSRDMVRLYTLILFSVHLISTHSCALPILTLIVPLGQ